MQGLHRLVNFSVVAQLCLAWPGNSFELLFIKETIAVSVLPPDTVGVRGDYFFTAAGPAVSDASLSYPFPVDSSAEYPCFIEVKDARTAKAVAFGRQGQAIMFSVAVRGLDTAAVTVVYKQHVKKNSGRYILTTTGIWGRPLIDSRYSVSVPDTMTLTYLSYECDSVVSTSHRLVYQFFKKQFMPDRDLAFVWTNSPGGSAGVRGAGKSVPDK